MLPLMVFGALLSFVGSMLFIWLAIIAFKESVIWGLVALFVPFGNVVFAVKHWEISKKPFLSGMACSVLGMVMIFGGFAVGAAQLQRQVMNDPEFQQAMADLGEIRMEAIEESGAMDDYVRSVQPDDAVANRRVPLTRDTGVIASSDSVGDRIAVPDAGQFSRSSKRGANRDVIRFDQAGKHLGSTVRVVGRNGIDMVVTLTESKVGALVFERHFHGGAATIEMTESEIESLHLVRR